MFFKHQKIKGRGNSQRRLGLGFRLQKGYGTHVTVKACSYRSLLDQSWGEHWVCFGFFFSSGGGSIFLIFNYHSFIFIFVFYNKGLQKTAKI